MTPDDTARVIRALRADVLTERLEARERGDAWDWMTYLKIMALIDQRLHNMAATADFYARVQEQP